MGQRSIFYSHLTILIILLAPSSIFCHIMTYIIHPSHHIILLGDAHAFWPNQPLELEHLKAIVQQASEKVNPYTMLIEDIYKPMNKQKLKDVSPSYLKTSLLRGLIQRIHHFQPYIRTIGIDRGEVVGRALFFPKFLLGRPFFENLSPKYLSRHSMPNAYTLRFSDLFNEVAQFKNDLLKRRRPEFDPQLHDFIDTMAYRMDHQLERIREILENQQINASESMLATIVRWWLLRKMTEHKDKIAEFQSLGWALEQFIRDYKNGMSNEEWEDRRKDLDYLYTSIFEREPEPVVIQQSLTAGFLTALKSMPLIRNCFSKPEEIIAAPPARELVALTDPSLHFQDQIKELNDCFLQLRLLIVDSHATLDIIDNLGRDITVIAGDLHIQNITRYLSKLGFKQSQCIVRDASKNAIPLNFDELPICFFP